ncbi:ankyrin repeat-containing protein, partial [Tanacetum coccineum]
SSFPNLVMTTDSSNSNTLHTTSVQGHVDVVNLLLSADSSPSKIARNNGQTLLHTTARIGHLEVISFIPSYDVAKMRLRFVAKPWLTYCECDIGTT